MHRFRLGPSRMEKLQILPSDCMYISVADFNHSVTTDFQCMGVTSMANPHQNVHEDFAVDVCAQVRIHCRFSAARPQNKTAPKNPHQLVWILPWIYHGYYSVINVRHQLDQTIPQRIQPCRQPQCNLEQKILLWSSLLILDCFWGGVKY